MELFGYYFHPSTENYDIKSFNTPFKLICNSGEVKNIMENLFIIIEEKADEFAERDSGWIMINLLFLEVNINKFNPLKASSFVELPIEIARRRAVINIWNNDNYCFAWSIVAALHPPTGPPFEISSYPHYSTILNITGIDFPYVIKR
ncbi:uncharacterized protein LOC115888205 [Sitophilus oryzae]|uniref:Uncharacterized protein LOC115888205 n=1 Tax=Sitophilus oryzae TaxID=7048 RepID=A0A6J2YKM6_SITOR|nr:uncharacterized protein LOC115888205 [Sitophilus oryzae]